MRSFLRLYPLLLIVCGLSSPSFAKYLEIEPILGWSSKTQGTESIKFARPCGTEVAGVVIAPSVEGSVQLGVAVHRDRKWCAGMPLEQWLNLPFVSPKLLDVVTPMDRAQPSPSKAVKMRAASSLMINGDQITIEYVDRCAPLYGAIIMARNEKQGYEIALVEDTANASKTCNPSPRQLRLKGMRFDRRQTDSLVLWKEKVEKPAIGLKGIVPNSIQIANGKVRFEYQRKCNEAPLGVAVAIDSETGGSSDKSVEIAMAVGKYPEISCDQSLSIKEVYTFTSEAFLSNAVLKPAKVKAAENIELRTPSEVSVQPASAERFLKISAVGSCERPWGVVYGNDVTGNMAVGLLESAGCKKELKHVSLSQGVRIGELDRISAMRI